MPRKVQTAQRPFTMLVANLQHGSDPSRNSGGNPVKVRNGFTLQHFPEVSREAANDRGTRGVDTGRTPGLATRVGYVDYTTSTLPVNASGTVTVASNVFTLPATLRLGEFVLVSGEAFTVAGTAADSATALAAAIDMLPGFSAAAVGALITITGPSGPNGNAVLFDAVYAGAVQNYTLAPTSGHLTGGEPSIGPPVIVP